jgi:myosin protein heavy chain
MSAPAQSGPTWRKDPFSRNSSVSPSSVLSLNGGRPKSTIISSPLSQSLGHVRHHSFSPMESGLLGRTASTRARSNSHRNNTPATGTFAPQFIKSDEIQTGLEPVHGIEGENDFSGKRYVWLKDPNTAFVKGWVVEELPDNRLVVQCDDGSVSTMKTICSSRWMLTLIATRGPFG